MLVSRRRLGQSIALLPLLPLFGCGADGIETYAATVRSAIDKLAPIVATLDPPQAEKIRAIQQVCDEAADAIAQLPKDADGKSALVKELVGKFVSRANELLSIAEAMRGLPENTKTILVATQLLIGLVASHYDIPLAPAEPTPGVHRFAVAATGAPHPRLYAAANARVEKASDKAQVGRDAQAEIHAWLKAP